MTLIQNTRQRSRALGLWRAAACSVDSLAAHRGIDEILASERLHASKAGAGRGVADNVFFDLSGYVYSPESGELIGSLTVGGGR